MFLKRMYRSYYVVALFVIMLAACGGETPPAADVLPLVEESPSEPPAAVEVTELPPPVVNNDGATAIEEEPTAPLSPTAVTLALEIGLEYNGIYLDPGGLGDVVINEVAQTAGNDAPQWAVHPAYTEFQFEEYPLPSSRQMPRLSIYPAADFANLNPSARDMIVNLEAILTEKPADFSEREIPHLPLINAAQVFRTQIEYVPFVNGEGIRFVTYYSQGIDAVSNEDIFYSFQGLTHDGAYYVSAVMPVDAPTLPEQPTPIEDMDAFVADYTNYLDGLIADLEGLSADAFLPTLGALDLMVMSLDVNPSVAPPPTTADGQVALAISQPPAGSQLPVGQAAVVTGFLSAGGAEPLELSLQAGANTLISTTVQSDIDSGTWSAELMVPINVTGPARLAVSTPSEAISQDVTLYNPEPEQGLVVLMLDQPIAGNVAVEGMPLFFHGRVTHPINETITMGVMVNGCTEFIARQSFTLTGGTWNGQVILPADVTGPACVAIYTGEYGKNWREIIQPIMILSREDETVPRVSIGNSFSTAVTGGGSVTLYGTAVNPPEGELTVAIKDMAGTTVAEAIVPVDSFGYWEAMLTFPAEYTDTSAILTAFFEEEEGLYFAEQGIAVR